MFFFTRLFFGNPLLLYWSFSSIVSLLTFDASLSCCRMWYSPSRMMLATSLSHNLFIVPHYGHPSFNKFAFALWTILCSSFQLIDFLLANLPIFAFFDSYTISIPSSIDQLLWMPISKFPIYVINATLCPTLAYSMTKKLSQIKNCPLSHCSSH